MLRQMSIVLCLLMVMMALAGCQAEVTPQDDLNYIAVETTLVVKGTIEDRTILSGRAMPQKDVMVMPTVPGTVEAVYVSIGQWVNKGDRLFAMNRDSISGQLSQAEAVYNSANANYQMTKDQIAAAKITFERMQTLYDEGAISRAQYEQAELAASDQPLEAAAAALQQAAVGYNNASNAYNDTVVKAPISGLITTVNIEAGEMAANTQPAVVVVDIDRLIVKLNITEKLVNAIEVGSEVDVAIPAVDTQTRGTIISASPMIDSRTMLYPVEVEILNPDRIIKASMYAEVSLITKQRLAVLKVPSSAVVVVDNQTIVYSVVDSKAQKNVVVIGLDNGSEIEITSGLTENDEIITSGQHYVSDGSVVKIIRGE